MKNIGLLTIGLLLAIPGMAQEAKTEQIKSSAKSETTSDVKVVRNKGEKENKEKAATKQHETRGTVVTEGSANNHGTVVNGVATTVVEAGSKGAIVSKVASTTGQLKSATNSVVKSIDVTSGATVKSSPKVKANVRANTNIDIKPVKVITNTKIRTGVSIK